MEYIYNTFLAGWCADAAGARLEFRKTRFTEKQAIDAMHFMGEKTNGINEGQFTDDSEMEIALLTALLKGINEPYFPTEYIAKEYIKWYKSNPFDIGRTTAFALVNANNALDMMGNAHKFNECSESNGSLMRCIPIAVFSLFKPYKLILEIAESDASLTHFSYIAKLVTGIYCCIISEILSNRLKGNNPDIKQLLNNVKNMCENNESIYTWYREGINISNLNDYDAIKNEGHVKHAFIMVIFFLNNINKYTYETSIIEVLKCGGDTDTNAKIVGNLLGAYYGNCIPEYMSKPVLEFECTNTYNTFYKRPSKYGIQNAVKLVNILIAQKYNCTDQKEK